MTETRYKPSSSFGITGLWACTECGGGVLDREAHDGFHGRQVEDEWFGLDNAEVREDVFVSGLRRSARLVHLPTGLSVSGDSQREAREKLAVVLASTARGTRHD